MNYTHVGGLRRPPKVLRQDRQAHRETAKHTHTGGARLTVQQTAAAIWLRDVLPEYRSDVFVSGRRVGFQRRTIVAALRQLGVVTEYVPGDRRPWLAMPVWRPVIRCRYCGSRVMVGPNCDPMMEDET